MPGNRRTWIYSIALAVAAMVMPAGRTDAQVLPIQNVGAAPGVYVEADGTVKRREVDERSELSGMRTRAKAAADATKDEKLAFVSLPKAFAVARQAIEAGKPVPDDVKYLGGLTQIKFVFVYGENQDLIIAGPAEPVRVVDELTAVGMRTARPVLRLEDLVVAMRTVQAARNNAFGCRLDPDPAAPGRISDAMAKLVRASRAERVKAVAKATGPQKVSFFGGLPADSRLALTTLAADYELKRYGLGLARSTVPGLGNGIDNSRQAVNMWWFELGYDPILVSPEGDAFALRGPRLKVQAGSFNWDPKGATKTAYDFAQRMTKNIEALAAEQPLIADLQCVADLAVLSALIQRDGLDRKAGWDTRWLLQTSGDPLSSFPVTKVVVPKFADALANYTNGSIAAGGVVLSPGAVVGGRRDTDEQKTIAGPKQAGDKLRAEKSKPAVVVQP
jgi:hypothetical protein